MAIERYLAMTAAEIHEISDFPEKLAWMACHFSPYSTGISNLPEIVPENSMLILNDITPIHGHDPDRIGKQLTGCIEKLKCSSILLDFQRKDHGETAALAKHLVAALPCPVAVSEQYADSLDCPVFLSPVPCHAPLTEHIKPWQNREIWLEIGLEGEVLELTESGCEILPLTAEEIPIEGRMDGQLHCHYKIQLTDNAARFTLWRTEDDLMEMLNEAEAIGIQTAVGLWQELK